MSLSCDADPGCRVWCWLGLAGWSASQVLRSCCEAGSMVLSVLPFAVSDLLAAELFQRS